MDIGRKIKNIINKPTILIICIVTVLIVFVVSAIRYGSQCVENNYVLSEIDDGTYAIYYETYSTVPAENYEMITVCFNNELYTFKGTVHVTYTDSEPYIIVRKYNSVNSDEVQLFVPKGTIKFKDDECMTYTLTDKNS